MTQEDLDNAKLEIERHRLELEREKWATEVQLRERELEIKSADQSSRNTEIELKRQDQNRAGWWNPLVVAIFAAAIAAGGNAVVTIVNGMQQRNIEDQKSEQARILEMIKTGDAEKAAENLQFLLDAGLIDNPERAQKVKAFLADRQPGTGPALPGGSIVGGIVGSDDAVAVDTLPREESIQAASRSVGRLNVVRENGEMSVCTAFLVANDLALTAGLCTKDASSAVLQLSDSGSSLEYTVQLPPLEEVIGPSGNFSLLRVSGTAGERWGTLDLNERAPTNGDKLATVYFRGGAVRKLAVLSTDCQIVRIEQHLFHHGCDTGPGSSGAPVLSRDGLHVLGLHYSRSPFGGEASRADVILKAINAHLEAR